MSRYRGTDEQLERELNAVRRLVQVRVRRAADDLKELEGTLAELRRELRRRRTSPLVSEAAPAAETVQT